MVGACYRRAVSRLGHVPKKPGLISKMASWIGTADGFFSLSLLAGAGLFLSAVFGYSAASPVTEHSPESEVAILTKIQITVGAEKVTATIEDNQTSRDFVALLPLTLEMEDFHGTEKISDLPGRLSTEGAPTGYAPTEGDITYYAPWGNLAIFYRDFSHSKGLIRLGQLDSGSELFKQGGGLKATIERAE